MIKRKNRREPIYASTVHEKKYAEKIDWSTVSIIIPAFNEESTVADVSKAAKSVPAKEVIVVNNNSSDGTAAEAKRAGVKVIDCPTPGKTEAMLAGVNATSAQTKVILFLDADLTGLTKEHIETIIIPFFRSGNKPANLMSMGTFDRGPEQNKQAWRFPMLFLTGQRALLKSEFNNSIKHTRVTAWEIEATLNAHFKDNDLATTAVVCDGLFHHIKEVKMSSPAKGRQAKNRMILEVVGAFIKYPFRKIKRLYIAATER